jgi:hypothetical protein
MITVARALKLSLDGNELVFTYTKYYLWLSSPENEWSRMVEVVGVEKLQTFDLLTGVSVGFRPKT